ncbi:hypothetical protein Cflav_PD1266 [Pedosphaera parvula Ellin514]|uniref:Uncharacterized protein n=2 Tax=Pedosphaera TaxID=1032526 RepID=B9XP76_PEDPL|nr:hypothetical protein Cflav_PD1266 [Pedosphaera parvula Ellin514]
MDEQHIGHRLIQITGPFSESNPCCHLQAGAVSSLHCYRIKSGYVAVKDTKFMTRQQTLDLYFMDARCKLIDLAAFIDRVERSPGEEDFRMKAFRQALTELSSGNTEKAKRVLLALSDPTTEPIPAATTKAACGAWPGTK